MSLTQAVPVEIERVLVPEARIAELVDELAARVNGDFGDGELILVGVLTGAVVLAADLMRRLTMPCRLDFIGVSSYGDGAVSSGRLEWHKRLGCEIAGRDVLLVEDIVDTGVTLARLQAELLAMRPRRLATCALLNKPDRRQGEVEVEYLGLDIPDEFVVGYGLDYAQQFRNLPYIGILRREVYR